MPLFSSFDDAWAWFAAGGDLVPIEAQRDRFTAGRAQFLSFQAPVLDPAILALARFVRDAVEDIEGILPLDDDLLHCTVLPAGFQVIARQRPDDVLRPDASRIAERAAQALGSTRAIDVTIGPVNVFPDALILEVHDGGALLATRRPLAGVVPAAPGDGDNAHYLPHVSLAFFADASCAPPLRERLPVLRQRPPVAARFDRIDFARWWFVGDPTEQPELEVLRSYALPA